MTPDLIQKRIEDLKAESRQLHLDALMYKEARDAVMDKLDEIWAEILDLEQALTDHRVREERDRGN